MLMTVDEFCPSTHPVAIKRLAEVRIQLLQSLQFSAPLPAGGAALRYVINAAVHRINMRRQRRDFYASPD